MNGVMNYQSNEDVLMTDAIAELGGKDTLAIFDARPKINAQANKLLGGGFEDTNYYLKVDFNFCDIDNIHAVTKSYEKMLEIPQT